MRPEFLILPCSASSGLSTRTHQPLPYQVSERGPPPFAQHGPQSVLIETESALHAGCSIEHGVSGVRVILTGPPYQKAGNTPCAGGV